MSALDQIQRLDLDGDTMLCAVDRTLPSCRFAIAFTGGGQDDPAGAPGAHRMMAELLLRGTETLDREAFHARFERMGSTVYSSVHGDMTTYRVSCLARFQRDTLALATEALLHPGFRPGEHEALRQEIADGLASERDEEDVLAAIWLRRALLSGSALARRPQGELPMVESIDLETLRAVYEERLHAGRIVAVAAGDVDVDHLAETVRSLRYGLERRGDAPPPLELPAFCGPRILLADLPEHEQVQLRVATFGLRGNDPKLIPFWLGTTAFAGTFTSPFTREVRDVRGWSYTAHVEFSRYGTLPAAWVLHSAPQLEDASACLDLELELYRSVAEIEDEAIELARSYLLNRQPLSVASAFDLIYPLLRRELLGPGAPAMADMPALLASCTPDQVRETLGETLRPDRFVALVLGTVGELSNAVRERFPEATVRDIDALDEQLWPFEHAWEVSE